MSLKRINFPFALLCLLLTFIVGLGSVKVDNTAEVGSFDTNTATLLELSETRVTSRLWELIFGNEQAASCETVLIPSGVVFGAKVKGLEVVVSDAKDTKGVESGDVIISLDEKRIQSINDIKEIVSASNGKTLTMVLSRGGAKVTALITPKKTAEGYKIGMVLKDGAAGIGTVTFINPKTGAFGGLGHGICDVEKGTPIPITGGEVTGVILGGVQKGECGKPGELCGILTDKHLGEVYANTSCGVFGKLDVIPEGENAIPVNVAAKSEVHNGEATIISTIKNGTPSEFKIKIFDIDINSQGSKSFKIKVTDPALISLTGGIVRGMSGSPIIQNGKLVGAVTHVMVADPTEGYGIFIENMLNASIARNELPKAA